MSRCFPRYAPDEALTFDLSRRPGSPSKWGAFWSQIGGTVRLRPRRFVRVHRSAIVQIDRIREVKPAAGGDEVVLRDGSSSRRKQASLDKLLHNPGRRRGSG